MIFDCFMFCDEIDMLKLRMAYLDNIVDHFVVAESRYTHTNSEKELVFAKNRDQFAQYAGKIIYIEVPQFPNPKSAWDVEHFQRNAIKTALWQCNDDDIIILSDVDEIVNVARILSQHKIDGPMLIDMHMYYYYLDNLNTNSLWDMAMISTWRELKDKDIGDRNTYPMLCHGHISDDPKLNGWHFSYLFGDQIGKYVSKVRSFAHQEYNRPYYRLNSRIRYCVANQMDLFERNMDFRRVPIEEYLDSRLVECINRLGFAEKYLLASKGNGSTKIVDWLYGMYYHHGIKDIILKIYRAAKRLTGK